MNGNGYTIVQAGAEAPAEEFVRRYVDLKDPTAGCRPCPDYGRYWTCPPYDVPAAEYWGRYETVLLRGMQFHFTRELLERRFTPEELAELYPGADRRPRPADGRASAGAVSRSGSADHRGVHAVRGVYPARRAALPPSRGGGLQSGISGLRRGGRRPGRVGLGAAVAPAG